MSASTASRLHVPAERLHQPPPPHMWAAPPKLGLRAAQARHGRIPGARECCPAVGLRFGLDDLYVGLDDLYVGLDDLYVLHHHVLWLKPCRQEPHRVLFDPHDVHAALRKLERQACPPDRIEVARVRASETRNGHPRVRRPPRPGLREIELDFSTVDLGAYQARRSRVITFCSGVRGRKLEPRIVPRFLINA